MTAFEAMMRLDSNQIVDMSHSVYILTITEEGGKMIVCDDEDDEDQLQQKMDKDNMLEGFFTLCNHPEWGEIAKNLRYIDLPYIFW